MRLSSVHDAPELHLAEALECFVASDASAVVEHTKQCALSPSLACEYRSMGRATSRSAHAHKRTFSWFLNHLVRSQGSVGRGATLSTPCAFVNGHTMCNWFRVIVLEDNDVVHLRAGAYGIFNASITERHTAVPRLLETLNMEVSQIMKGGYDTFMQARSSDLSPIGISAVEFC